MLKDSAQARLWLKRLQKPLILLAVMGVLTALQPAIFPTAGNFSNILLAISIYGVMTCGAIFPVLLGGIDLSVGAVAAMGGACVVLTTVHFGGTHGGVALGCLAGLLAGAGIGLLHGLIIKKFAVPAFLVTLASLNIIYGLTQLLTGNLVISLLGPASFNFIGSGKVSGVPFPIILLAAAAVLAWFALNRTVFGRRVYAVGGNPAAAALSGVPVLRTTLLAYMASGTAAAAAGIILASMNQQAIAKAAQGYEADVLTAIVVGGTSLMGGEGTLQGCIYGALLVGLLNNGLRLEGVSAIYHGLVKGLVIVLAVAYDWKTRNRGSGLQFRKAARRPAAPSPTVAG